MFAFLLLSTNALAQEKGSGSWSMMNVKARLNNKWSVYTELQLRSLSIYQRFYYYEIKGGMTYSFLPGYSFTLGTGFYNTFNEGPDYENYSRQEEVRLWQQFIMQQKLSVLEIEHRYRTEQRFKEVYENRFRYRLNVSVPVNKKEIVPNAVYVSVYNELFFTDKVPHFSRNRFHSGLGYVFNDHISLQSGWLRQVDFNKSQIRKKNYLLVSVSYEF